MGGRPFTEGSLVRAKQGLVEAKGVLGIAKGGLVRAKGSLGLAKPSLLAFEASFCLFCRSLLADFFSLPLVLFAPHLFYASLNYE